MAASMILPGGPLLIANQELVSRVSGLLGVPKLVAHHGETPRQVPG